MSRPSSGIASPRKMRSRTQSISSDRPSTISYSLMSPPLAVSPEACFIAASAASQIVTNDHDGHADTWYDQNGIEPSGETALVSPGALHLVNGFLDQLLFNFLCISRSTNLSALRPAVSEVLKPKLAKDAINQADEELREYLGGGDDEDTMSNPGSASPRDWDLELVWKRARLRCMVYSSLGDMEEEDEDYYMEQEHLDAGLEDRLAGVVSPAVAIFLTSILEFMGEQALIISGQAAYHRLRVKYEKELKEGARSPGEVADRVVVEELDMERVALDRTLGRLWRAWKKKIRSPGLDKTMSRSFSRDSMRGITGHMRQSSFTAESFVPPTVPEPGPESEADIKELTEELVEEEPTEEYILAANIPLPMGDNDVEEIEIPWLVAYSDDEDDEDELEEETAPPRPKSLVILPRTAAADLSTPTLSPAIPTPRKRSNSLPSHYRAKMRAAELSLTVQTSTGEVEEGPSALEDPTEEIDEDESPQNHDAELSEGATLVSPTTEEIEEYSETRTSHRRRSNRVSDIMTGAVAIGSTAVVGVPGIAKSPALETEVEPSDNEDGEDDDFVEEPQILTSSRISISGRSASPAVSEHGKLTPTNFSLPVRPPSVHSLRLIEVSGLRSPSTRSWASSPDGNDYGRTGPFSATNSASTPPIVEESRTPASAVFVAVETEVGQPSPELGANTSSPISRVEEVADVRGVSQTPVTSAVDSTSKPKASDPYDEFESEAPPIFGSAVRYNSQPPSPAKPTTTKVTILQSSTSSGTFFVDDRPKVPEKVSSHSRTQASVPSPRAPERSPNRHSNGGSATPGHHETISQSASIGIVSVERSRARTVSEASGSGLHDQSGAVTRQLHTSGSSSTTSTNRLRPIRTSEDSSNTKADVLRNFEELIQSDQTIQYTLTPENMRDIEVGCLPALEMTHHANAVQAQSSKSLSNGSPMVPVKSRRSEDARLAGDRSRSSSLNQSNEVPRSPSLSHPSGLRSHSVTESPVNVSKPNGPIPRSAPSVAPKSRVNAPQARDARLPRESLADFAEFIRSTGPPGEGGSAGGNAFTRAAGPTAVRNGGGPLPVPKESIESSRASMTTNSTRVRLQAREAAVANRDDNSDLIDFIRRGPPSATVNRIPRTVAPFRTTMDSDQMAGAVGGRAVDAQIRDIDVRGSETSTTVTEYSMPSVHSSSINSQTGLLRNKALPAQGINRQGALDADMPIPQRKSRRARDPYAIDFSDDEEDEDSGPRPTRNAPQKEESLADFLKNYAPPSETPVQPLAVSQLQNRPKKKSSAQSLISRFTRRDGTQTSGNMGGPRSPRSPKALPDAPRSPSIRSSGGRGYIPIQVNMPPGVDRYNPSYGAPKAMSSMGGGAPGSTGRVRMKFEPREAVSVPSRSGTSDLADFLRNSEPPPGAMASEVYPSKGGRDDANGFSRVFASRKKTSFA